MPQVIELAGAAAGIGPLALTPDASVHVLHLDSELAKYGTSCKAKKEESEDVNTLPWAEGKGHVVRNTR